MNKKAGKSRAGGRVMLVDDDRNITATLSIFLKNEGFEVASFADGHEALAALQGGGAEGAGAGATAGAGAYDIGVFDIKMPRMDGLELLRRVRESSAMPVIFLTSKDDEIDELVGLKIGADDYITKPFSQKLLAERIRAILRRVRLADTPEKETGAAGVKEAEDILQRGRLTLNAARHECLWDGGKVNLTVTEFLILQSLAARPGYVKSRDALMDAAYDDQVYVDDRTIDSHIKRLRRKFRQVDKNFDGIETLYGVGYRFKA